MPLVRMGAMYHSLGVSGWTTIESSDLFLLAYGKVIQLHKNLPPFLLGFKKALASQIHVEVAVKQTYLCTCVCVFVYAWKGRELRESPGLFIRSSTESRTRAGVIAARSSVCESARLRQDCVSRRRRTSRTVDVTARVPLPWQGRECFHHRPVSSSIVLNNDSVLVFKSRLKTFLFSQAFSSSFAY